MYCRKNKIYKGIMVGIIAMQLVQGSSEIWAKEVLVVEVGEGQKLNYKDIETDRDCIPEAFCVGENGEVYILDNAVKEIKCYGEGGYIEGIAVEYSEHIRDMIYMDKNLYLLDQEALKLYQIDTGTRGQEVIELPTSWQAERVIGLGVDTQNGCPIIQYDKKCYSIKNNQVEVLEEIEINSGKIIALDEGKQVIEKYKISELPLVTGSVDIQRLDEEGNIKEQLIIPLGSRYEKSPYKIIDYTLDGEVYQMITEKDQVIIEKKRMKKLLRNNKRIKSDTSRQGEIIEGFEELRRVYAGYTRCQSIDEAVEMSTLQWYEDNKQSQVLPEEIVQPSYLATSHMPIRYGIPYCWGGFNGVTNEYSLSFLSALERGAIPGNIKCSGDWKKGTAGLDCSGYVAKATGFEEKLNTSNLAHLKYTYPICQSSREPYDIYVKAGDHVLFFVEELGNGIVTREATTSGRQKVKLYFRPYSWLINNGYTLRRFYGW